MDACAVDQLGDLRVAAIVTAQVLNQIEKHFAAHHFITMHVANELELWFPWRWREREQEGEGHVYVVTVKQERWRQGGRQTSSGTEKYSKIKYISKRFLHLQNHFLS